MGRTGSYSEEARIIRTMNKLKFNKVVPINSMKGDCAEDTGMLNQLFRDAESFLKSFAWCRNLSEAYFGLGVGRIVGVFLFRIEPTDSTIDNFLWVIVGDLPPAYIVTDHSPTPRAALEAYIAEMRRWIAGIRKRALPDDVIPVNAAPTLENADRLESRLEFIEKEILPYH